MLPHCSLCLVAKESLEFSWRYACAVNELWQAGLAAVMLTHGRKECDQCTTELGAAALDFRSVINPVHKAGEVNHLHDDDDPELQQGCLGESLVERVNDNAYN